LNWTLLEKAQSMQLEACLPDSWWEFAFATATHVYNHTPIKRLKWKTPQEIFTDEKPKILHLRCHDLAKWLSQYLYSFSFSFLFF